MAIVTVNSGSSSLKVGLYSDNGESLLLSAAVDGIGKPGASLKLSGAGGEALERSTADFSHLQDAFDATVRAMHAHDAATVTAIGHRIVHGGPALTAHQRLTPEVQQQLEAAVHFAPLHIPPALELIRHTETRFPEAAQFACFDTAFHQTMPPEAFTYAIPQPYRKAGVRRYGFHGLSYESIVHALGDAVPERTIVAHLGSGASACAMRHGQSVDTSMGVSPTGGFPMATRTGDLDPGVLLLLEGTLAPGLAALSREALEQMLNHESGMKALAGESDMRQLLVRADTGDGPAALAVAIFCRDIAKTLAGYAAVLGGLDLLVFTGGIGEHSAPIRQRIGDQLGLLGVRLDTAANEAKNPTILSPKGQPVRVCVMAADENGQIARHVAVLSQ